MKSSLKYKKIALVGFLLISTLLFTLPCSAMFVSESNKVYNPLVTLSLTYIGEGGDYVTVDLTPPVPEEVNNATFSQYVDTQGVIYDNIYQYESNYNSYLRYTLKDTDFSDNGGTYEIYGGDFFLSSNTAFPTITLPQNFGALYEVTIKYRSSKDLTQVTKTYNNGYQNLQGTVELLNDYVKADIFKNDGYIYVEEISYQFVYAPLSSAQVYGLRSGDTRDTTITDLAGTEWYIPAGWTAVSGYGRFDIGAIVNDADYSGMSDREFDVGYGFEPMDGIYPLANVITFGNYAYYSYSSNTALNIKFVDGEDSTSSSLLSWLQANGSLVEDTPSLSAPTLSIIDDTLSWSTVTGADSYKIFCNGVQVDTVSAPSLTYDIPVETLYNYDVLVEGINTFYVVASNQTEDSASSNTVQYTYTAPSTPTERQDYLTITYCYKQYEGNNSTSYEYFSRLKNEAYSEGYNNGSDATGGIDFSSWIANAVSGFINAELFPGFTLGGVLGIIVAFSVVMLFLKFFAGG